MRRVCELASLALVLTACTDGGPEPKSLELVEDEPTVEAHAGFEHQPDRERVIAPISQPRPNGQPRLELVARYVEPETGLCPYAVEQRGFPAISEDGATLVEVYGFIPGNADEIDARLELTWLDAAEVRVEQVYDRSDEAPGDAAACEAAEQRVREQIAALNAKLASRTWRGLESLDAFFSSPGFALAQEHFGWAEDEVLASLSGTDRPVEVYYRNGHFIARVRGLEVLQDTPRPEWRQREEESCVIDAQISAIEFDRATRAALVRYNHSSGGCLCDDRDYFARIELSPELLEAADRRSTSKFVIAQRERMQADEGVEE